MMRLRQLQVLDIVEFPGPPKLNQTLWPDHCVQGSWGAQLHEDLKVRYSRTKDYARARPIEKKIGKFYQVAAAPSNFGLSMWILHSKQMSQPIANFPWHFMKLGQLYQSPPTFTGH